MVKSTIASYIEFNERQLTKEELLDEIENALECAHRAAEGTFCQIPKSNNKSSIINLIVIIPGGFKST